MRSPQAETDGGKEAPPEWIEIRCPFCFRLFFKFMVYPVLDEVKGLNKIAWHAKCSRCKEEYFKTVVL